MRRRALPPLLAVAVTLLLSPSLALAGMRPHATLTEIAEARLETISVFGVILLAGAFVAQRVWNGLRRDFVSMPYLSYARACGLIALWGLLFAIVLAMISGARELMTPGAWEKRADGGYRLAGTKGASDEAARREHLQKLQSALWTYAKAHDGNLPPHAHVDGIDPQTWTAPHEDGARYVYVGGRRADTGKLLVAYEPAPFGDRRLVLLSDGSVASLSIGEIEDRFIDETIEPVK